MVCFVLYSQNNNTADGEGPSPLRCSKAWQVSDTIPQHQKSSPEKKQESSFSNPAFQFYKSPNQKAPLKIIKIT